MGSIIKEDITTFYLSNKPIVCPIRTLFAVIVLSMFFFQKITTQGNSAPAAYTRAANFGDGRF